MIELVYEVYRLSYEYRKLNNKSPTRVIVTQLKWNQMIKEYESYGILNHSKTIIGLPIEIGPITQVY